MLFTTTHNPRPLIMATSREELDTPRYGSDRWLLGSIILLMMFGVLAVYSSIAFFAETKGTSAGNLIIGHITKAGMALSVMLFLSKIPYRTVLKFSRVFLVLSWIFLIIVMVYGQSTFGAKRSLTVGGFSFQPSTIAAFSLFLHLVVLLDSKKAYIKQFKRSFVPIMFWVVVTCSLIGIEDFSSSAVVFAISLAIMFVGRISFHHLGSLILIGVLGGAVLVFSSNERQRRVQNYIDQVITIKSDDFAGDEGYQSQQSQIAVARGEIFGVGIGKSGQRDFLPAPYNDFIFAIIAEEYGLMGGLFVMGIYVFILIRGTLFIAKNAHDDKGKLLAVACTLSITTYAFINAAVAVGLLPVTGLPMPFISYGGTSMIFTGAMAGILLNISRKSKKVEKEASDDE